MLVVATKASSVCQFTLVTVRRPRLVLGLVTTREDRALWTWVRSSAWLTIYVCKCYLVDTDVKWIKPNQIYLLINPVGGGHSCAIVSCRCAYCCPEPIDGKIIWHRSSYFVGAICYVQHCELSYNVLGMTENCNHTEWIYILPYRVWDLACWW